MSRMTVLEGYHCCSTEVIEARAQGIPRPPITLLVDGPSIVTLQKAVWKQSLAMVEWGQSELVNCMVPTCSYIKAAASWRRGEQICCQDMTKPFLRHSPSLLDLNTTVPQLKTVNIVFHSNTICCRQLIHT